MSRILWSANAPWSPSGYGEQTAMFVPRLKDLGHELAIACNFGLQGAIQDWQGITCYPSDGHWSNKALATYLDHHQADLAVILHDAWVLAPHEWADGPPVAVWAPIDHYPIPPAVLAVLSHERIRPIAMSRFGETLMEKAGLNPLYVPHGIDTGLFCPRPELKQQVRKQLDIPEDAFLVGMIAANKANPSLPRKAFPQAFHAFARFAKEHEDAWMYVHTEAQPTNAGINLDLLATAVGCPEGRLRFPPEEAWHLPQTREVMAVIYQAFDVLLNPSMGEGFGIPVLEAQASGVPVIASDHSAMTELAQAGWLVAGDPWWDALQSSFFIVPFIDSITAALEAAYKARDDQNLRAGAAAFARQYDADLITERYWKPALEALVRPREAPPLKVAASSNGLNRAQRRQLARAKA